MATKTTVKKCFHSVLNFYRYYSISLCSLDVGKFFLDLNSKVQEKRKGMVALCSHLRQNVKLNSFTS